MKEYIKLFETPEAGDEYMIKDIPWTAYVKSTDQKLVCNSENKKTINSNGTLIIVEGETIFTLLDGTKVVFSGDTIMQSDISEFKNDIVSVVIASSTKDVEDMAFSECQELTSVTICENSISKIRGYVFVSCPKLEHVVMPEGIMNIADGAFRNCQSLLSIRIPGSVKSIGREAFMNCSALTEVYIEDGVERIERLSFDECVNLRYINIPDSVKYVDENAFYGCENLPVIDNIMYADTYLVKCVNKEITGCTIHEDTRFIGGEAFDGCDITEITIPDNVQYIYGNAFSNTHLSSITIPNSVVLISNDALGNVSDIHVEDLSSWCKIKFDGGTPMSGSFGECNLYVGENLLTYLLIPEDITEINDYTFSNIKSIESVYVHSGVTSIGENAFYMCGNLSNINIPSTVEYVSTSAFYGCTGFTVDNNGIRYADTFLIEAVDKAQSQYTLKNGVRFIGNYAFRGCTNLNTFEIPNTVTEIGVGVFDGCISLPVEEDGLKYAGTYLVGIATTGMTRTEYYVKEGTTWIGYGAFAEDYNIGESDYVVNTIHLPSSVKIIDDHAMHHSSTINSVNLPSGLVRIGICSFYMYVYGSTLDLVVPSTVTEIRENAFTDVRSVVISKLLPFKNQIFAIDENGSMSVGFLSVDESTFAGDFNVSTLFELGYNWTKNPHTYEVYTDNETIIEQLNKAAEETDTIFNIHPLP